MGLSRELRLALVIGILAGVMAIAGFALGLVAFMREERVTEDVRTILLENEQVVAGATTLAGTFVAALTSVPSGSFALADKGKSLTSTNWSALSINTTGYWSQIGNMVWFQCTIRWDVTGGPFNPGAGIPNAAANDEMRVEFVSGNVWPVPKSAEKFSQLTMTMNDDLGHQHPNLRTGLGGTSAGWPHGCILSDGTIVLLAHRGATPPVPMLWNNWAHPGSGLAACDVAFTNGATWFEHRLQGLYELP